MLRALLQHAVPCCAVQMDGPACSSDEGSDDAPSEDDEDFDLDESEDEGPKKKKKGKGKAAAPKGKKQSAAAEGGAAKVGLGGMLLRSKHHVVIMHMAGVLSAVGARCVLLPRAGKGQ